MGGGGRRRPPQQKRDALCGLAVAFPDRSRYVRIVNWNCSRGKHEVKLPPLLRLRPDLAVLQETPRPTSRIAETQLWHGTKDNQGLLILSFGKWRVEQADAPHPELQFFLPAHVIGPKERFNLLAVWTKPGTRHPLYVTTLLDGLRHYERFIGSAPTVVIGDFNVYWHRDDDANQRLDLISAYHTFFNVDVGSEKHATLHFYWQEERPFHFDYCLIPRVWRRRLKSVEVGAYNQWTGARLSDHCPVIIDLSDRR